MILLASAAVARAAGAPPDERTAREELLVGVEAHLKGDDAAAARALKRCARKAAAGSRDESDCRLYSGMLREILAPGAPVPDEKGEARRAYLQGREDYLHGAYAGADRRWHDCLTAADSGPASRPDCLMALELIAARRREASEPAPVASDAARAAQQAYLEGMIYYQKEDIEKARERWTDCAAQNADCRVGLERLEKLWGSSTAPDGKK
jgi:hypothetical protein